MIASLAIFAVLLPLALGVPSPRGRGGGGGGGGVGNVGLGYVGGSLIANSQNGAFGWAPPDSGTDGKGTCTYSGGNTTTIPLAAQQGWQSSMTTCLNDLNAENWSGTTCTPLTGGTLGCYKGEDDYSDPVDCFTRCQGCLSSAIAANQAVTTKCQYEYRTSRLVGYKTHTCTMGYHT